MICHCKADLVPHDAETGVKKGALHCYACGCCFLSDGVTPREGVPPCAQARVSLSSAEPEFSLPAQGGHPPSVTPEPDEALPQVSPDQAPLAEPRTRSRR